MNPKKYHSKESFETEEQFSCVFHSDVIPMAISTIEDGRFVEVNNAFLKTTGYRRDEVIGRASSELNLFVEENTRENIRRKFAQSGQVSNEAIKVRTRSGKIRTGLFSVKQIGFGEEDCWLTVMIDMTDQLRLEQNLRQAQKMDSIGQLAGGVSHDFNNMLMAVMGYANLCLDQLDKNHPIRKWLYEIRKISTRSSDMVSQLMAFSRKSSLDPRRLDINDSIEKMLNMLRRLIGENIQLQWSPGQDVGSIKFDPIQIDQIVANLTINARDAINGNGTITIETAPTTLDDESCRVIEGIEAGEYALLKVTDDGRGMDAATLDKIFEPFFTTKQQGKGTGLGLSTVYGIVKQNNAGIDVESHPGRGTTFRIYIPVCHNISLNDKAGQGSETEDLPRGNGETILLAEDETAVCDIVAEQLQRLGYNVLTSENGEEALQKIDENPRGIDLVFADLVMPRMSGRELCEKVAAKYPHIPRLFMSGYTANTAQDAVLTTEDPILTKPISRETIARKVKEAIG